MRAPALRRLAAGAVDAGLGLLLAVALAPSTGRWCAARAALILGLDEPGSRWKGPVPLALGVAGDLVYGLPLALLLVLLAGPLLGRTAGALAARIRVARPDGSEPSAARRWAHHAVGAAPWWTWCAALITGSRALALLAVGLLLALAAGLLPAAGGRRALHDLLAGTEVRRDDGPAADHR